MEESYNKKPDASMSDDLQPAYNDLLELVQKNKLIPNFLDNLTPDDPRLLCLKKAIRKGNFWAQIWNYRHCNLYLIYLMQTKMIPFWQGITAYVYLIAKMQYPKKQKLRPEDQDVKFNYQVNMVSLVKVGKITVLGYQYLLGVTRALENLNVYLNFDQLTTYVLKLPRIEQCVIKTEFNHHLTSHEAKHDANRLISVLMNNLPLIQKVSVGCYDDPSTHYLVPSSSMINYFLQAMNKQPMRMRPVLGNPGLATLYHWHAQDFHPVSLYAPQILSNPKTADGYRCGPFAMWLHDIGHTFWASMLSKAQRDYIFTTYIPALGYLKGMAAAYADDLSLETLKKFEIKAYDFDLTAILDYADRETRFATYLAHTIGKNPIYPSCLYTGVYEYEALGRAEGDRLYFLLHYCLYNAKLPETYKEVYKILISFVSTGESYRNPRVVIALQTLAKNAASYPHSLFADEPSLLKVDSLHWQMLLNSKRSSEELWLEVTNDQDLAYDLLSMIEQGVIFFHPYFPMTATKRLALLDSLEKQRSASAKISKEQCGNGNIESKFQTLFFSLNSPLGFRQVPRAEDPELSSNLEKTAVQSVYKL
jgi:hypothetical protein